MAKAPPKTPPKTTKRTTTPKAKSNGTEVKSALVDLDARLEEREEVEPETLDLFRLGGVTYTIPAEPPPAVILRFMDMLETKGEAISVSWLLRRFIGDEGYQALLDCEEMSTADFEEILSVVQSIAMGVGTPVGKG